MTHVETERDICGRLEDGKKPCTIVVASVRGGRHIESNESEVLEVVDIHICLFAVFPNSR